MNTYLIIHLGCSIFNLLFCFNVLQKETLQISFRANIIFAMIITVAAPIITAAIIWKKFEKL